MKTKISVPKQIIPFVCIIIIIVKAPALLLVGLVLVIIIQQSEPKIKTVKIANTAKRAQTSCYHKNKLFANVSAYTSEIKQDSLIPGLLVDDEDTSNSSLDFERFPSCPTTLPRLDTHFNFVEDTNHIDKTNSTNVNWTAIHLELEYDQQREEIMHDFKKIPILNNTLMKRAPVYGIQDKAKQIFEYTQQLSPQELTSPDYQEELLETPDDINIIEFTPEPTKSTQLGNRFKKAVKKIRQTTNKPAGPSNFYKSPQINRSHDDLASILPNSSVSTRIHDRFKVKLNKLLKK